MKKYVTTFVAAIALLTAISQANADEPAKSNGDPITSIATSILLNSVKGNIEGMKREDGDLDKVIRGVTGISIKDIKEQGILGGPCSFFRNPLGQGC